MEEEAREAVARQRDVDIETSLHLVIGVHVRRTDFHQFSKYRMEELLHQTFYLEAVIYFLVVSESDDQDIQDIFIDLLRQNMRQHMKIVFNIR